tara:strand:+ start:3898 stop:5082 length:1185 start_codon:yes stop_codon:yes gene_type:complete
MSMEDPTWWPSGIAQQSMEEALADGELRTSFGRVQLWNPSDALEAAWWHNPPGNGVQWGEWPKNVEQVSHISEDVYGLLLLINETYVARICPFFVGEDVSRMARYEPWNSSVTDLPLLLPIGGWTAGEHDRVLIYSRFEPAKFDADPQQVHGLVTSLARLHSALAPHATPNTERLWNERLKAMEDTLKPHTLWRAPHTASTVGLPPLEVNIEHLAVAEHGAMWIALPRSLPDYLVCQSERLPSLAAVMRIERLWSGHLELTSNHRQGLLEVWANHVPSSWSKGKALSTAMGGPWVWRYNAVLERLLLARTYGDADLEQQSLEWLGEVSRLQARLGTLRMWKAGLWVAIIGLLVAFFGHELNTLTDVQSIALAASSLGFGVLTNRIYWAKDPPPY